MGRRANRRSSTYQHLPKGLLGDIQQGRTKKPEQILCMNCGTRAVLYASKQQAEAALKEGSNPRDFICCLDGTINMVHLVPRA